MFVPIARFEGVDVSRVDEQAAERKRQIDAAGSGDVPAEIAQQVEKLQGAVKRYYQLVDRENGTTLGVTFCDTEQDVRTADEALNAMTPAAGEGSRTGVEIYEVLLDESFS